MLQEFDSATKVLQKKDTTVVQAPSLLDSIVMAFPSTGRQLKSNAIICHGPVTEFASCKVEQMSEDFLTDANVSSIAMLLCKLPSQVVTNTESSYAVLVLKRQKLGRNYSNWRYVNTRFVLPTSNIFKYCYSKTGLSLEDRRESILPTNAEKQLLLYGSWFFYGTCLMSNEQVLKKSGWMHVYF